MPIEDLHPGASVQYSTLVARTFEDLKGVSSSAELDSRIITRHVFQISESRAIGDPDVLITEESLRMLNEMAVNRARGMPIAYLLGTREFWSLDFIVTPAVLVPRPESEILVDHGLASITGRPEPLEILDLGTGSGALAVAIASELRKQGKVFRVIAIDRSTAALEVAARNVDRHGLSGVIDLREGDWMLGLNPRVDQFDLIVANPPYLSRFEKCSPELSFEPAEALFSEQGGLADVRRLVAEAGIFLKPGGVFLCEFGCGKRGAVRELMEELKRPNRWQFIGDLDRGDGFTVLRVCGVD